MNAVTNIAEARKASEVETLQASLDAINLKIAELAADVTAEAVSAFTVLKERAAVVEKALRAAIRKEKAEPADDADLDAAAEIIERTKAEIRVWLEENDVNFVASSGVYWRHDPQAGTWDTMSAMSLAKVFPTIGSRAAYAVFDEVMTEEKRTFMRTTYSFRPQAGNVLNLLRYRFAEAQDGEHHWIFDVLMRSLCGGQADAIEHLEKLILSKWQRPDNPGLPVPVFMDASGGTGKSVFAEKVLPNIFGKGAVAPNVSMEMITGSFNDFGVGKAVVVINEAADGKADFDRVKALIGSSTLVCNPKGLKAFEVEQTAWHLIFGNERNSVVRITGTEVDRRWSVIKPTRPLVEWLAEDLSRQIGETVTVEDARTWLSEDGMKIIADPDQAAKWLGSLVRRHGVVGDVQRLHGADYQSAADASKPLCVQVFEAFFDPADLKPVARKTVWELYAEIVRADRVRFPMGRNAFFAELDAWLAKQRPQLETVNKKLGSARTNTSVVQPIGCHYPPDQLDWYSQDERGNREWYVEIR